MFKKITGNIMAIILAAGMFLGAVGVVIPEPVHAEDDHYCELALTIDSLTDNGEDLMDVLSETSLTVTIGGKTYSAKENGCKVTLSNLSESPKSFKFYIIADHVKHSSTVDTDFAEIGSGRDSEWFGTYKWTYSYTITHYHRNNHRWDYSAEGNVITAECSGDYNCPLETPTLTLNADDKEYNGKPVKASLTPGDTWKTENWLPEISEDNITYSTDNPKNAGTYTASYTSGGVTAAKQFTIKKKGVIVGGVKVLDKEYDGTTKATVDTSGVGFFGKVSGDDLSVSVTGEFEDPEEGWDKTVYLTYELTGADAGNYEIVDTPFSPKTVKAKIYVKGNGGPDDSDDYDAAAAARMVSEAVEYIYWLGTYNGAVPKAKSVKVKAARKSFTVTWKKLSAKHRKKFSKVEIQYCTDGRFNKSTTVVRERGKTRTSLKVTGRKTGKVYYVRVRNIKYAYNKKYVSRWSAVKKVRIK